MKKLKLILASTLLLSVDAMAMTSKVDEPTKTVYKVVEGTTVNQVAKTGIPVDISYKAQHVNVGEVSDVTVTITTSLSSGTLQVNLRGLEDDIIGIDRSDVEFKLSSDRHSFPINLQLSSSTDGIHYLNVTATVVGQGSRVLAVPLNVGEISSKIENQSNEKSADGSVISVSSADEEIK